MEQAQHDIVKKVFAHLGRYDFGAAREAQKHLKSFKQFSAIFALLIDAEHACLLGTKDYSSCFEELRKAITIRDRKMNVLNELSMYADVRVATALVYQALIDSAPLSNYGELLDHVNGGIVQTKAFVSPCLQELKLLLLCELRSLQGFLSAAYLIGFFKMKDSLTSIHDFRLDIESWRTALKGFSVLALPAILAWYAAALNFLVSKCGLYFSSVLGQHDRILSSPAAGSLAAPLVDFAAQLSTFCHKMSGFSCAAVIVNSELLPKGKIGYSLFERDAVADPSWEVAVLVPETALGVYSSSHDRIVKSMLDRTRVAKKTAGMTCGADAGHTSSYFVTRLDSADVWLVVIVSPEKRKSREMSDFHRKFQDDVTGKTLIATLFNRKRKGSWW